MHWVTFLASIAVLGAVIYRAQQKKASKAKVLEFPGPTQLPFIGRIHDLPIQYMVSRLSLSSDMLRYQAGHVYS